MKILRPLLVILVAVLIGNGYFAEIACSQDVPVYSGAIETRDSIPYFIMLGDPQIDVPYMGWHENNYSAVREIFRKIASENPAFTFLLGDLAFFGNSASLWKKFDKLSAPLRDANIPVFPITGNHEYLTDNTNFSNYSELYKNLFQRFPHLEGNTYYELDFKNVAILGLNSNFDQLSPKEKREQEKWYGERLNAIEKDTKITFVIVACHHAPYTNSTEVHDDERVQKSFVIPFKAATKAKLFITGHCHSYEHFVFDGKHFLVSGGAGPHQKLQKNEGGLKSDLYDGPAIRDHHYCKITPSATVLQVEMVALSSNNKTWAVKDTLNIR
jgi:hypothetical protein